MIWGFNWAICVISEFACVASCPTLTLACWLLLFDRRAQRGDGRWPAAFRRRPPARASAADVGWLANAFSALAKLLICVDRLLSPKRLQLLLKVRVNRVERVGCAVVRVGGEDFALQVLIDLLRHADRFDARAQNQRTGTVAGSRRDVAVVPGCSRACSRWRCSDRPPGCRWRTRRERWMQFRAPR